MEGFNELIPQNLLAIFDGNELEVSALFHLFHRSTIVAGIWTLFIHEAAHSQKCLILHHLQWILNVTSWLNRPHLVYLLNLTFFVFFIFSSVTGVFLISCAKNARKNLTYIYLSYEIMLENHAQ